MNIIFSYDLDSCTASISGDSTLTEVAFAVESAASHFLGRGVNKFDCTRTRLYNGACGLTFKALKESGPMKFSKVCSVYNCVKAGIFPHNIPEKEKFQLEEKGFGNVSEGQHRHGKMPSVVGKKTDESYTISVVETHDLVPDLPIDVLTYGLGDMFTGLFALGVNYVKWQGSLKLIQLYIKHKLSDKQLFDFLSSNKDYEVNREVSTLT